MNPDVVCLVCRRHYDLPKSLYVCKRCLLNTRKYNRDGDKASNDWEADRSMFSSCRKITRHIKPNSTKKLHEQHAQDDDSIQVEMPKLNYFQPSINSVKLKVETVEFSCQKCQSVVFQSEKELRNHQCLDHSNFRSKKSVKCYFTFNIVDLDSVVDVSHKSNLLPSNDSGYVFRKDLSFSNAKNLDRHSDGDEKYFSDDDDVIFEGMIDNKDSDSNFPPVSGLVSPVSGNILSSTSDVTFNFDATSSPSHLSDPHGYICPITGIIRPISSGIVHSNQVTTDSFVKPTTGSIPWVSNTTLSRSDNLVPDKKRQVHGYVVSKSPATEPGRSICIQGEGKTPGSSFIKGNPCINNGVVSNVHPTYHRDRLIKEYADYDLSNIDRFESDSQSCFQCDECNLSFARGELLDQHLSLFYNPLEDKTPKAVTCHRCKTMSFSSFKHLDEHLRRVHRDYRNFECHTCFALMKTLTDLTEHQLENGCEVKNEYTKPIVVDDDDEVLGVVDPTQVKPFKCHTCGLEFNHPMSMEFHIKCKHKMIKDFDCPLCPRTFSGKGELNVHINIFHHKIRKFECTFCSYNACQKGVLKAHVRVVHNKERNFKCSTCPKTYATKWDLETHIKSVHEKVFDHLCSICAKCFNRKRRLDLHTRKAHQKIYDYKCNHCKKKFDNTELLKEHLKVDHGDIPNHQCKQCPKTALLLETLCGHMRRVHRKVKKGSK